MKNSQYINQVNISINDMLRMQFTEVGANGEVNEVAVLSMLPACAESIVEVLSKALKQHKETVEAQKKILETDKELN